MNFNLNEAYLTDTSNEYLTPITFHVNNTYLARLNRLSKKLGCSKTDVLYKSITTLEMWLDQQEYDI